LIHIDTTESCTVSTRMATRSTDVCCRSSHPASAMEKFKRLILIARVCNNLVGNIIRDVTLQVPDEHVDGIQILEGARSGHRRECRPAGGLAHVLSAVVAGTLSRSFPRSR
jgi:hypothetical protein